MTLLLVVSLTGPAWARLGETPEQLIARCGEATGKNHLGGSAEQVAVDTMDFKKSGFDIHVALFNGVSAYEIIRKSTNDPITDDETKTLLDSNSQDHHWTAVTGQPRLWPGNDGQMRPIAGKLWQRDDGAKAVLGANLDGVFQIISKELIDAEAAAYKAAHTTSLEGF